MIINKLLIMKFDGGEISDRLTAPGKIYTLLVLHCLTSFWAEDVFSRKSPSIGSDVGSNNSHGKAENIY